MSASVFHCLNNNATSTADTLFVMIKQERTTYYCLDYLHNNHEHHKIMRDDSSTTTLSADDDSTRVTPADRRKIVDWCYSVIDHCQFDRETVAIAMELADRFLSSQRASDARMISEILHSRRLYQLTAMSALYIAIKLNERVAFGSDFFSAMSRGAYSVEEVEEMELAIRKGVSWIVNPPMSFQVSLHILSLVVSE